MQHMHLRRCVCARISALRPPIIPPLPRHSSTRLLSTVTNDDIAIGIDGNEMEEEDEEELPTNENDVELLKIRHTSAHVMAMAVQRTYSEAQVTIGPWIDNGFYYDFYFP